MAASFALMKNHLLNLHCNNCKKILSVGPIRLNNGIYTCGRCSSLFGEHVTIYEELAKFMSFPCTNDLCPAQLKWGEVSNHERNCPYKLMDCPKPNCKLCYNVSDAYQHFTTIHKELVYEQDLQIKRTLRDIPLENFNRDRGAYLLCHENQSYVVMVFGTCKEDRYEPGYIGSYSYSFGVFYLYKNEKTKTHYDLTVKITDDQDIHTTYSWKNQEIREYTNENCLGCLDKNCYKGHTNKPKKFLWNQINNILNDGCHYVIKYSVKLVNNKSNIQTAPSSVNSTLSSKLECPICYEYLCAPIYICANGHSVCSKCRKKIRTCPLCQAIIGNSRNYSLEEISETLEVCCANAIKGCTFIGKVKNTKQHTLSNCPFN